VSTLTHLTFVAYGRPTPQAGMRAVATARGPRQITTGGVGLAAWRNTIVAAAMKAANGGRIPGAVTIEARFRLPMPASRPKGRRLYPWPSTVRPDLDKLIRGCLDALTASGVIDDDAKVWQLTATKHEVWEGWTGVDVTITGGAA
jgi:Holliday junction resolvase RusA-like endonuclease